MGITFVKRNMSLPLSTVFIVDDDPSVRRSLSRLVKQAGFDGHAFSSAEEFLQKITGPLSRPSCLVADLQMPGLSGLDLQHALSCSLAACPVILISGNATLPDTTLAIKQGAVTFLPKPSDPERLLRAIDEALERHRATLHGKGT